jgi:hypothetical protein
VVTVPGRSAEDDRESLKGIKSCVAEMSLPPVPAATYLEHLSTMQEEAVMRSRWLGRRFGSSDGGSAAINKSLTSGLVAVKQRPPGLAGRIGSKAGRICLGIGDGSVRRQ